MRIDSNLATISFLLAKDLEVRTNNSGGITYSTDHNALNLDPRVLDRCDYNTFVIVILYVQHNPAKYIPKH